MSWSYDAAVTVPAAWLDHATAQPSECAVPVGPSGECWVHGVARCRASVAGINQGIRQELDALR